VPDRDQQGQQLFDGYETSVSAYDTTLLHAGEFPVAIECEGDRDVINATVTLDDDNSWPDVVLISVYLRNHPPWMCSSEPDIPFIPSTVPFRVFAVKLSSREQFVDTPTVYYNFKLRTFCYRQAGDVRSGNERDPNTVVSILYRVPDRLSDFIKLPKVREYNCKMALCMRALLQQLNILDLVHIIIVTSMHAYQEFNYAQYCEHTLNKYY